MASSHLLASVVLFIGCCYLGAVIGEPDKWWQNIVIYELYPQSFYDSDGDGLGDLKGVEMKVDYLKDLGIGAVWLNPFYKSPMVDNGYDISDYRGIDPRYGTMKDFEDLLRKLRENDIEFIMDFVLNHSSDQNEWFKKSVEKIEPYTDYYVWRDPHEWRAGRPVPPNNWAPVLGKHSGPGSAWQWSPERKQFYYHAFFKEQPDLNFRNPKVVEEMKGVLKFWMDKGVRGFRFDAVPWIVEDELFRNEAPWSQEYTQNTQETYSLLEDFRAFLDAYGEEHGVEIFMTTEAYATAEQVKRYYGLNDRPGAHFPFNFDLLSELTAETNAAMLNNTIITYLASLSGDQYPNWVSGNHDTSRIQTRMGASTGADILNAVSLLLPGTATVYMGDEIGMDSYWNMDKSECPPGVADDFRTPNRTPFQWSTARNAGFTEAVKPWIPVNPEHYHINVATESKSEVSFLSNFKTFAKLKSTPIFEKGKLSTYVLDEFVFAFARQHKSSTSIVLINLAKFFSKPINLPSKIPSIKGATLNGVPVVSVNLADLCSKRTDCGDKLTKDQFEMPPKSVIVLSYWSPQKRTLKKTRSGASFLNRQLMLEEEKLRRKNSIKFTVN